jgi:FemAB-related protein (PEP-CTERM system-associated)
MSVSNACTAEEWNAYVAAHPLGTIDHLWQWRAIFRDVFRHESEYLVARRSGRITGVLPLVLFRSRLFGRSVVSLPMLNYGGLLTDAAELSGPLLAEAERIARDFGARYVELRHRSKLTDLPATERKVSVFRDLPADTDLLWQGLDRKVRNQVRKAQKSDLTVDAVGAPRDFYRVFAENMRDLGTPVYSRRLFESVSDAFGERVRFHVVRHSGHPVAAGVTLVHNGTVLVPWASSLRRYRHLSPNMLLYWSMLEHAIRSGARIFDFGRSSADGSTLPFKLQWGGQAMPQHWEYVLLGAAAPPQHGPANPKFNAAIAAWKRMPLGIANVFGPAIVRHIP